jgi:alcohol dehydrogenase (cytochrome c)
MLLARKIMVRSLGLLTLLVLGASIWLFLFDARLAWRREIVTFKLAGCLPGDDWLGVARRITPLFLAKPFEFQGLRLDVSESFGKDTTAGAELFEQRCSACHGKHGHGGTTGIDLSSRELQAKLSDLDIYMALTRGIAGTNMPPAAVTVTEGLKLTAYIRSLGEEGDAQEQTAVSADECAGCKDIAVSPEDVAKSPARGEWLSYSGDYSGWRFSPLKQITKKNVSRLRPRFIYQLRSITGLQPTPLVANGVMFLTGAENEVIALDLDSGKPFWTYRHIVSSEVMICCGRQNRGLALMGDRVFHGTLDAHLLALDARTGRKIWDATVADIHEGYSMTGAPLAIGNAVVVGVAGADFGIRGFLAAYDPETGKRLWRFDAIPEPGQPGSETWENDAWQRGGGSTWVTGSYDPDLDLIYWGVGNPGPEFNPASRPGDNLYTNSVVALDAKTGALRWHYQFTPNDGNDWDSCQTPVLLNAQFQGSDRKLLLFGNRNCFYYILDRETGQFLAATELCKQNWASGFTAEGRPMRRPETNVTAEGTPPILPGVAGGPNWPPSAYNPVVNLFYVKNSEKPQRIFSSDEDYVKGRLFLGGYASGPQDSLIHVTALNALTGDIVWKRTLRELDGENDKSGILATASGLVLTGDSERRLVALDAQTGDEIWLYQLGGQMAMPPITYLHNGAQEVAVISGGSLFVLGLPE